MRQNNIPHKEEDFKYQRQITARSKIDVMKWHHDSTGQNMFKVINKDTQSDNVLRRIKDTVKIYDEVFCQNNLRLKTIHYFHEIIS